MLGCCCSVWDSGWCSRDGLDGGDLLMEDGFEDGGGSGGLWLLLESEEEWEWMDGEFDRLMMDGECCELVPRSLEISVSVSSSSSSCWVAAAAAAAMFCSAGCSSMVRWWCSVWGR